MTPTNPQDSLTKKAEEPCCEPSHKETCCEPSAKAGCCGTAVEPKKGCC